MKNKSANLRQLFSNQNLFKNNLLKTFSLLKNIQHVNFYFRGNKNPL